MNDSYRDERVYQTILKIKSELKLLTNDDYYFRPCAHQHHMCPISKIETDILIYYNRPCLERKVYNVRKHKSKQETG